MFQIKVLFALCLLALPVITHAEAEQYSRAARHLNEGKYFESAITDLEAVVQAEPKNAAYHLALGCAEADRAASLAHAAEWQALLTATRESSLRQRDFWDSAQRDPENSLYGTPAPPALVPLAPLKTRDDYQIYRLTLAELITRTNALSRDAQAQWAQAVTLSQSPAEKAEAEYAQGWGLTLLQTSREAIDSLAGARQEPTKDPLPPVTPGPTNKEIVGAFTASVKDAPDTAIYWQSLGDAQMQDDAGYSAEPALSLASYRKSLLLEPRNIPLWFHVYLTESRSRSHLPAECEADLRQLAARDGQNAFPQYELASILFGKTKYDTRRKMVFGPKEETQRAWEQAMPSLQSAHSEQAAREGIAAIQRGNASPTYAIPPYVPPVPKMLLTAWHYGDWRRGQSQLMSWLAWRRQLARAASGYGYYLRGLGRFNEAENTAWATLAMGSRMIGNWSLRPNSSPGDRVVMETRVGVAIAAEGNAALLTLAQQTEDADLMEIAQEISDELTVKNNAYRTEVLQKAKNSTAALDAGLLTAY